MSSHVHLHRLSIIVGIFIDSGSCRPTRYTRPALPRNLGEVMRRQDTLPDDILNDSGDSDSNDEDTIDMKMMMMMMMIYI